MPEWVVVADSSPLIGLARIGQLEILRKLASRVLMPPAVRDEATLRRIGTVGLLRRAKKAGLILTVKPHLEALMANGIFIHRALLDAVLKDLGES